MTSLGVWIKAGVIIFKTKLSRKRCVACDERFYLLSIPIDPVTMKSATEKCEEFISAGIPRHVLTADALGIFQANNDPELMMIMNSADLSTPDGAGVILAAKMNGLALPSRVSGVDLVTELAKISNDKGYRIFIFGAEEGVAKTAADNLCAAYPSLQISGTRNGYYTEKEEPEIVEEIKNSKSDILFVALGIPRQERFIYKYKEYLGIPVMIGVGGSFDVISGKLNRAPIFFQKCGLEWLYRALKEPKTRIKRMQGLPQFILLSWKKRKKS